MLINKCFTAFHHVVSKPFLEIYCTALLDHSIYTDYRNIYINWGLGLSPKGDVTSGRKKLSVAKILFTRLER